MAEPPLTNAATELVRSLLDMTEAPSGPSGSTEDFVLEDRTRRQGLNLGRIVGPTELRKLVSSAFEVAESPRFSVVEVYAVRGQRAAALATLIDFGDGNISVDGAVQVVQIDATLSLLHRWYMFDTVEEALACLDDLPD